MNGDCLTGDLSIELFYDTAKTVEFFLEALLPYCLAFSILSFLLYFVFSADEFLFITCLEADYALYLLSNLD